MTAGEKTLWKRGPWVITRIIRSNRLRVDHGVHSDWPVLYTPGGKPWHVGWDHPEEVPQDVRRKVRSILMNDHGPNVVWAHRKAYGPQKRMRR